ncbi:MAG: pyridoxamine 5'-phosphate oxidase family protein [Novosphingobium sp.]|nr:pyridoxamine 5'-phosphate oxidase family protein [Novosphingobium sp.]
MSLLTDLPDNVVAMLRRTLVTEFATVSAAGVPIDTPVSYFNPDDLATIDVATGLSYPAKAERARRNPKVGLLIAGAKNEPIVSIAGRAAVRDANLQDNALRYIAETGFSRPHNPPWELARNAVWYWTRMIIEVAPAKVMWWDDRAAMDSAPHCILAPAGTDYPASDPPPPGTISKPSNWPDQSWRALAEETVGMGGTAHLSLCDDEGYPLPIPVRDIRLTDEGLAMRIPAGVPWQRKGKASLTFYGRQTFVGAVSSEGEDTLLAIERALPIHPFVADDSVMWEPQEEVREAFMSRLSHEVERRGQPIPTLPNMEPEPTAGAKIRIARYGERGLF